MGLENTLVEKGELESRTLVLLAHQSSPLSVCIDFTVGMESTVASDLINWEVRGEFPVMRQMSEIWYHEEVPCLIPCQPGLVVAEKSL